MICLMPNCAFLSETSRMIQIYHALRDLGADACIANHGGLHQSLLHREGVASYDIVGPPMDEARSRHEVKWHWVKGHAGHALNERADGLANRGVEELRGR